MNSSRYLTLFVIICCIYLVSPYALKSARRLRLSENERECTNSVVRFLENEDSVDLDGFHELSGLEKYVTVFNESVSMMHNGNPQMRRFGRAFSRSIDKLQPNSLGEGLAGAMDLNRRIANSFGGPLTKCETFKDFERDYNKLKESYGTRVGHSDTLLPMIKDVILSSDLSFYDVNNDLSVLYATLGVLRTLTKPDKQVECDTAELDAVLSMVGDKQKIPN